MPEITLEKLVRLQTLVVGFVLSSQSAGCMDTGGTGASSTSTGGYVGNNGGSGNPSLTSGGDSSGAGGVTSGGTPSVNGGAGDPSGGSTNGNGLGTNYYGYLPHVWATYTGDTSWNKLATDAYAMLKALPNTVNIEFYWCARAGLGQ